MRILVFGGTGTIGGACVEFANKSGNEVTVASRSNKDAGALVLGDDFSGLDAVKSPFDAVIWAQGLNTNDRADNADSFHTVMEANVAFIVKSFQALYGRELLAHPSRLVLISSVWQNLARENKFSYVVSKSAINGLVNAFNADYAQHGIVTNAVLPGVVESPMTSRNLTREQIDNVTRQTPTKSLVSTTELAKSVLWLASADSSGVVGQCITVDHGWSSFREI
jgi:3-oxoacyl-[acyl-carrier protein] reductase